jgi:triphosphoribosyl-dephospho-CoA synthase
MPRHSLTECISLACLLEVTASKPGNVHRGADFADLTFADFAVSAVRVAPHLASAHELGVGRAALAALAATRECVPTNVNLGILLLLAPLAAVPRHESLASGVLMVLASLSAKDSELLWQTIQQAQPGGLGELPEYDLAAAPPSDILVAMKAAAPRDLVAAQYANGFRHVFDYVAPWLLEGCLQGWTLTESIVFTHVRLIASFSDSLIARKAGKPIAKNAAEFARHVLQAGLPGQEEYHAALADFDFWLRSDGNKRNPGTTADLIAAGLFAVLREEWLAPPYR